MTREQQLHAMAKGMYVGTHGGSWGMAHTADRMSYMRKAERALDALTAAGMVVVPREPTEGGTQE